MTKKTPITVAHGDGIGPEVMGATLAILEAAQAELLIHEVEIGEKVYLAGSKTGIESKTWDTIRKTKAFLKAPITTPQGGGFKSLNVTIRTALGLYANVRPCVSYHPFIATKHPDMDVVVIRENEEDLYCGIEYRQSPQVRTATKIISDVGSEKIIRYAFEYARTHNREKVTCFVKDNILKLSDGLFHQTFNAIAAQYPEIASDHWIIDIGAAKLADTPELFDVVVMPNLYGDILSDVGAQIAGSVGLVGSANIGKDHAMFEAIHGSAPRRAGQNVANPSALILASVLMLLHIDQREAAAKIHNGWLKTIEEGIHTYDIYDPKVSREKVGTKEFAVAVCARLGQTPSQLKPVHYEKKKEAQKPVYFEGKKKEEKREMTGVDVYLFLEEKAAIIEKRLTEFKPPARFELKMISNRGARIYPEGLPETFCVDQWRVRFLSKTKTCTQNEILALLSEMVKNKFDIIKTENLYEFDQVPGYSSPKS